MSERQANRWSALRRAALVWTACLAMFAHSSAGELDERVWQELLVFIQGKPADFDDARKLLEDDPEWFDKTAVALASLARKSRYHVGVMPIPDWVQDPPPGVPRWSDLTPDQAEEFRQKAHRAFESVPDFGKATWETYFILEALERLADLDSVRLVGPLLSETADVLDPLSDAPTPGVQQRSVDSLTAMHFFNPDLFGGESPHTLEEWRAWWAKNETRFGPIPKPLADLEAENQKAQTAPAAAVQSAAPSETPSPPQSPGPRPQKQDRAKMSPKPTWLKFLPLLIVPACLVLVLLLLRKRR